MDKILNNRPKDTVLKPENAFISLQSACL